MYKIFFGDRLLALSDSWDDCLADPNAIACKSTKKTDIKELVLNFSAAPQQKALYLLADNLPALLCEVKGLFVYIEAAGGLVRNTRGEVLMIYRNNRWDLPKGRCEENEMREETALREVEEECGISGLQLFQRITSTYHVYHEEEKMVLKRTDWYAMSYGGTATPVPQTIEAIEKAEWIPLAKLPVILPAVYCSIYEVFRAAGLTGEE